MFCAWMVNPRKRFKTEEFIAAFTHVANTWNAVKLAENIRYVRRGTYRLKDSIFGYELALELLTIAKPFYPLQQWVAESFYRQSHQDLPVILPDLIMGRHRTVLALVSMNLPNHFFVGPVLKVRSTINRFMILLSSTVAREIASKSWENDSNRISWIRTKSTSIVEENLGSFYYNCSN